MRIHHFATATVGLTFLLLLIGGLVHGTGSSLACPDWPLCFGSFFPEMKGNVLVEPPVVEMIAADSVLGVAYLISYWLTTRVLSLVYSVSAADDALGGMWAVLATVFVLRDSYSKSLAAALSRMAATLVSFALCLRLADTAIGEAVGAAALACHAPYREREFA